MTMGKLFTHTHSSVNKLYLAISTVTQRSIASGVRNYEYVLWWNQQPVQILLSLLLLERLIHCIKRSINVYDVCQLWFPEIDNFYHQKHYRSITTDSNHQQNPGSHSHHSILPNISPAILCIVVVWPVYPSTYISTVHVQTVTSSSLQFMSHQHRIAAVHDFTVTKIVTMSGQRVICHVNVCGWCHGSTGQCVPE